MYTECKKMPEHKKRTRRGRSNLPQLRGPSAQPFLQVNPPKYVFPTKSMRYGTPYKNPAADAEKSPSHIYFFFFLFFFLASRDGNADFAAIYAYLCNSNQRAAMDHAKMYRKFSFSAQSLVAVNVGQNFRRYLTNHDSVLTLGQSWSVVC